MAKKIKWSIIQGAKLMFPFIEKCLSKIDSLNSIHASSTWQSDKKEELSLLEFYCLTHADKKIGRFAQLRTFMPSQGLLVSDRVRKE